MALTDLSFPVTAKKIGPGFASLSRPKVFYLSSSELLVGPIPDIRNSASVLKLNSLAKRKVELYETPDEFLAAQALSQGATNAIVFTKHYQNLAPTSSATAADQNAASKYYNEVTTVNSGTVRLPDPMTRRLAIIVNGTTGAVNVRAGATSSATASQQNRIDGATGAYVIAAGERIHFVAPTASTAGSVALWRTAADVGA